MSARRTNARAAGADHYDTLGVPRDADAPTIKAAYRRRSAAAHPDRQGGSDDAMKAVNQAYEVLGDPARRADYDAGGTGTGARTREDMARSMLVSMAESAIRAPGAGDIVRSMRGMVDAAREAAEHEIRAQKRKAARLRERRASVRRKSEGENLVHALIDQQVAAAEREILQTTEILQALDCAHRMLDDYESVPCVTTFRDARDDDWNALFTSSTGSRT